SLIGPKMLNRNSPTPDQANGGIVRFWIFWPVRQAGRRDLLLRLLAERLVATVGGSRLGIGHRTLLSVKNWSAMSFEDGANGPGFRAPTHGKETLQFLIPPLRFCSKSSSCI